ncbi:PAS domain S-box protein [Flavitalea sp. BT771]|uniref:sensor histidine kinase n=1 Tax=Flavitalea sp. BT771 TaxID=3063329 RepID=UPI0026E32FF6|nr:PAS domain-containing sensor histidine kinase [Flavitalea sp. BT771]MDO6430544.1 PAS domain S-box protein [Flavitalea sp. BT771]MDV6219316.1 PAS domain S-box protein [Flavitalea sp. BT771]
MNDLFQDINASELEGAAQTWLAAIIHSSDDAIISKTLDGIVSSWNEGARRIFGYEAAEMIGQPILRLIPPDRLGEEPAILERLKRGERVDHFETKRVTKYGVILDISLSISPIRDSKGQIIGASKIARNITGQKEAERIINEGKERFRQELEDTVRERTRELAEMNHRLTKSNHELEQFAYIASHDLQEPLRKIHVFSELLEEGLNSGADAASLAKYLHRIKNASLRMSRLIKDVLEYSRLSRAELVIAPVDLNEIIKEVLMEFDLSVAEKKAIISVGPLPVINGIGSQFRQLFRNLVGNSLKFSQQEPRISVRAEKATPAELPDTLPRNGTSKFFRISFQDNGIGFEQQHAGMVFGIFQRLNSQDAYSGSGIGLALCKKIVENHDGAITATSEPGKGATFNVFLPA